MSSRPMSGMPATAAWFLPEILQVASRGFITLLGFVVLNSHNITWKCYFAFQGKWRSQLLKRMHPEAGFCSIRLFLSRASLYPKVRCVGWMKYFGKEQEFKVGSLINQLQAILHLEIFFTVASTAVTLVLKDICVRAPLGRTICCHAGLLGSGNYRFLC